MVNTEKGLQLTRECNHPDARWLVSLFPAGAAVTRERLMMLKQGEDPRALFVAAGAQLGVDNGIRNALLKRAAEVGYAPAQARLGDPDQVHENFFDWAERAASQGDREDWYQLGPTLYISQGWTPP